MAIDWLKMFPETGPPSCCGKWRMIKNYLICFIYPIRLTYWRPCRQTFLPNDDAHRWDKLIRVCKNFWTMIVACVTRLDMDFNFGAGCLQMGSIKKVEPSQMRFPSWTSRGIWTTNSYSLQHVARVIKSNLFRQISKLIFNGPFIASLLFIHVISMQKTVVIKFGNGIRTAKP